MPERFKLVGGCVHGQSHGQFHATTLDRIRQRSLASSTLKQQHGTNAFIAAHQQNHARLAQWHSCCRGLCNSVGLAVITYAAGFRQTSHLPSRSSVISIICQIPHAGSPEAVARSQPAWGKKTLTWGLDTPEFSKRQSANATVSSCSQCKEGRGTGLASPLRGRRPVI
jgi:hypothetical protein